MVFSYGGDRGTRYCVRSDGRTFRGTKGYRISSTGLGPVELKISISVQLPIQIHRLCIGNIWVRCIPLSLRSKTRRRATPLLPTLIYSCRPRGTVSCALPFTTNVTVSTSISQTLLGSNIPSSPAYGVFISQLIRYVRACSSYDRFILRAARLSSKLLGQGYVMECLKCPSGS